MSKVAIVTDSSAFIPENVSSQYSIFTIPLLLLWEGKVYKDGIDIQPAEFYRRMKASKVAPTTSQPSPNEFLELYKKLLDQDYDILSIHISSKFSGTLDSAHKAQEILSKERITVIDSKTTSMALSFQVMAAARYAKEGATLSECAEISHNAVKHTGVYFLVDDLEYLRRGGRIGGAAALLGTVLNLKPILTIRNGQIEPSEKVRTMSKAIDRMLDQFEKQMEKYGPPVRLACLFADTPALAEVLLDRAKQRIPTASIAEALLGPVSPVIGSHVGPGTLGLCYMAGM